METGSSIDVSGLWVDKPAGANLIDVQMNSVNLRDDYGQKKGIIKGDTVTINPLYGSKIGSDISGYLTTAEKSARDQSTAGGTIDISTGAGDFILKTGANLNFAGGGFNYAAGNTSGTKLVSGNTVYDISVAPEWLSYGTILGTQQTTHARWGVTEVYNGLYFGGGNAVSDRSVAYSQGSDAGSLSLRAANIVLDGGVNGKATAGAFQSVRTAGAADSDARKLSIAEGLEMPLGGTLIIGDPDTAGTGDHRLGNVVLKEEVAPLSDLTVNSPQQTTTYLSTDKLGSAGLSSLSIFSNLSVTTAQGSALTLDPGSTFTISARRIENNGAITIHDGTVNFALTDNKTSEHWNQVGLDTTPNPDYVALQEQIYLAKGSSIDVSGQHVDNSSAGTASGVSTFNYITGGSISFTDTRELGTEVIAAGGAVLDVSGGYGIDAKGNVTGGDAGTLEVRAPTVVLNADLSGFSLPGNAGGALILQAKQVNVVKGWGATSDLPVTGQVTVGDSRFADTGFSRLTLRSYNDLVLPAGINFQPSYVKLAAPLPGAGSTVNNAGPNGATANKTISVGADFVGASSFTAKAGDPLYTGTTFYNPADNPATDPNYNKLQVSLDKGASIAMAPGGKVFLSGPVVAIAGSINAPAGTISAQSSIGDITVTGSLLANGYNLANSSTIYGLSVGPKPLAAGSVSLTSSKGNINLEAGSIIDVSGSAAVANLQPSASGAPSQVMVAGNAGTLNLTSGGEINVNGTINAKPAMAGVQGGTLSMVKGGSFNLSAGLIEQQQQNGFDALTFGSSDSLVFSGGMTINAGRKLTLDAPVIKENGSDTVTLSAPYLVLQSSISPATPTVAPDGGKAVLNLSGGWIDITGVVQASGFSDITLKAQHDLRLNDYYYNSNNTWGGSFTTPGNLTLQAGILYPMTQASFTLHAGKKITILGNGVTPGPVYSAGGNLTINGEGGIEQDGVVEAPLGTITLMSAANRVYLGDGSITSTAAGSSINYGSLDADLNWTTTPHSVNTASADVTAAPDKSVTLTGSEVVVGNKATINISGGGSVYSFLFQPGIEGTSDPFSKSGRYVIMPDNSIQLPDAKAVYLAGGDGIKAGIYSCLPEQYAFLPGAMVITATGNTVAPGGTSVSQEGYPVVGGYMTVLGTNIRSPQLQGFSVQTAATVLTEGHFDIKQFIAGDAGALKASGTTTMLQGTISAAALNGYRGGTLDLSGNQVIVQSGPINLGNIDFSSTLPTGVAGTLQISDQSLDGKGLAELRLGDSSVTDSVTIAGGSKVDVPLITLTANKTISIEAGAALTAHAADGSGSITLSAPQGAVTIADSALVNAGSNMTIEANNAVLNSNIKTNNGVTHLIGNQVYVVSSAADADPAQSGIYLTTGLWDSIGSKGALTLSGHTGVTFVGDLSSLQKLHSLTIDTPRLAGIGQTAGLNMNISATGIDLLNSGKTNGKSLSSAQTAQTGTVTFTADNIVLGGNSDPAGQGVLLMDGFRSITLASMGDLTLMGKGAITTGWTSSQTGQELVLQGARLVTAPYRDSAGNYQRADFTIDGSYGAVSFAKSAGTAGTSTSAGGRLQMTGDSITIAGEIDLPAGEIDLTAGGTAGINLKSGAQLLSQGVLAPTAETGKSTAYAGGTISLLATNGPVLVDSGAALDVSAVAGGDAGAITLAAPQGVVTLNGDIHGNATTGRGGSLTLDTNSALDLSALNGKLQSGGFTEQLDIRSRQGDLVVAAGQTLRGRNVTLTADAGAIDVQGQGAISADGDAIDQNGGRVALYAGTGLILEAGSLISAQGTAAGAKGGTVLLNSAASGMTGGNYALQVNSGSQMNVTGGAGATGGTVAFRAYQLGANDVNMALLGGTITGASRVSVEAVRSYQVTGNIGSQSAYSDDAYTFMNNAAATLKTRLFGSSAGDPNYHLQAGIELDSTGSLTFDTAWDLSTIRPGNEPGVLTLRAAGNLNINSDLVDAPTPLNAGKGNVLKKGTAVPSWDFNLVSGADLNSANPLAVLPGAGNLTVADGTMVYTEKAAIRFAAGNDMTIGAAQATSDLPKMISTSIPYNIGTYDGEISGTVNNDLTLNGGVIQSATGAINISTGGDLMLNYDSSGTLIGSIRTTGEYTARSAYKGERLSGFPAGFFDYWSYSGGGDIRLQVGKSLSCQLAAPDSTGITPGWDMATTDVNGLHWSASFNNLYKNPFAVTTQGVATMGGGSIAIKSGGNLTGQFGAFGTGDLLIAAGGDLSGRFLVKNGAVMMTAGGNLAPLSPARLDAAGRVIALADGSLFEVFHGNIEVSVQGNVTLGTVANPTIVSGLFAYMDNNSGQNNWNMDPGYENSSVSLSAVNGDLSIIGDTSLYPSRTDNNPSTMQSLKSILPPTLDAYAGGSIRLLQDSVVLAPSPTGTLRLVAAGLDIDGGLLMADGTFRRGAIYVSDMDPSLVYGLHPSFQVAQLFTNANHTSIPLHKNDTNNPNVISAKRDIADLRLYLPKETSISAGLDITDIYVEGQNVNSADVSSITAGRNITLNNLFSLDEPTINGLRSSIIEQGGPGSLLFMAGGSIDLGNTQGIQEVGNTIDHGLPDDKSGLFVVAGASPDLTVDKIAAFFPLLRTSGSNYSKLLAAGKTVQAQQVVQNFRTAQIAPLFANASGTAGSGQINMISSEISNLGSNGDIFVVAAGDINVGRSTISLNSTTTAQSTGIFTAAGGTINIFAKRDVNVNESRVMTFLGGDITIWSDEGSINAGRGSKTAISALPPQSVPQYDQNGNIIGYTTVFSPPSVGSGIRAVTYDPNLVPGGPIPIPPPGNIYIFAPQGVIDAGEAGIAGGKVILGATEVLNSQNISFSAGSVGVPTPQSSVSLSSLAGAGSVADTGKMVAQASALGGAKDSLAQSNVVDQFLSKFLDVKVIDFDTDEGNADNDKQDKEKKKKK
jgi:hypothetical protein